MQPSRRQLLRSSALSLSVLGGCLTTDDSTAPETTRRTTTSESTETATATETHPSLLCNLGPHPDSRWPLPDGSPGRTNYAPNASGPTTEPTDKWTVTATESESGSVSFTRPTVADGRVYVGRVVSPGPSVPAPDEKYVHAYDAETGERQWRATVSERPTSPVIAGNQVLVHDGDTLYAFDSTNGNERWTYGPPGSIESALPTADGILVASNRSDTDDEVLSLDLDGGVEWRVTIPASLNSNSKLAWVDERAYVTTADAVLVAIDTAEKNVAWTRNLHDGEDTAPAMVVATSCAAFAAVDGVLYAVRRNDTLAWSVESGIRELAMDGETIYGVNGSGYVRSIAVADGERRWERFYGNDDRRMTDGIYGEPAVDAETVYAGTLDGKLLALSTDDGSERWTIERDWPDAAKVSVVDDTLYTAWGDRLVAFR